MKKWLVVALILAGCASERASENKQYILPEMSAARLTAPEAVVLIVNTELSEHLNQRGLVYRTSNTEIVQAQHNLWAQGIKKQLNRRIVSGLLARQSLYWPVEANAALDLTNKPQLQVHLQRFNGVYTGLAELAGEWQLINGSGQIVANEHFYIEVPLAEPGYPALVAALSTGLEQLTGEIAKALGNIKHIKRSN